MLARPGTRAPTVSSAAFERPVQVRPPEPATVPSFAPGQWVLPTLVRVLPVRPVRVPAHSSSALPRAGPPSSLAPGPSPVVASSTPGPSPAAVIPVSDAAAHAVGVAFASISIESDVHKLLCSRRAPLLGKAAVDAGAAIDEEHRRPRKRNPEFETAAAREEYQLESEVEALLPLLPVATVVAMLGGPRGLAQVSAADRPAILRRRLHARSGACGERVARTRHLLARVRKYAVVNLGFSREECDEAVLPMSSALAHALISQANREATDRGVGSRGGRCVGHAVREDIKRAAKVLSWPIEVDLDSWDTAAPKATVGGKTKAGTLPIAAKCQLEFFASGGLPEWVSGAARESAEFITRSLLSGGIDQGVRVGEGVRVDIAPDAEDPCGLMCGVAHMGKDGAPLEICAPAEGFLGPYDWWPAHLEKIATVGQVFPAWVRPHGSRGSVLRAGGLTRFVAKPEHIRAALKELLTLPPLSYTTKELKEMNIQGHSAHASLPEWGAAVGENPMLEGVTLAPELALGFSDADIDALGNWLRNAAARNEASAAEAARAAPAEQARRAAAIATLPGRAASRGAMRIYYGQGGALGNRVGQRFKLVRVRQRLVHVVRAALRGREWRSLPRGQKDLGILRSTGAAPS